MALPKIQKPQDWLTQLWNIVFGRKIDHETDKWLLGPIGDIGGIADRFANRLAQEESLTVHHNLPSSGLMDGFNDFGSTQENLNPKIEEFYTSTTNFDLDVWTQWKPLWGSGGYLVYKLFSQRIQQLNLPRKSMDTAFGLNSQIISLQDSTGNIKYRVWFRRLKKSNEVVYSGIYTHCTIPSGEKCLKIIFPLPQGSATIIMQVNTDDKGNLHLSSKGTKYGDPGLYFMVEDRLGHLWKHYLPSFHEHIFVVEDEEGILRADHSMSLWGWKVYELHYKMTQKIGAICSDTDKRLGE